MKTENPIPSNCAFFKPVEIVDELKSPSVSRLCFFYEDKGRDVSFARWRVCFYYESHKALTKFFASEKAKNEFLSSLEVEARA